MAEHVQVARLSNTHEQVMNWLILNPDQPLRACADHFGYTQAWLSSLIHSDMFQAALAAKQEKVFSRVAESIPQKLRVATDIALDKLAGKIAENEDPEFLLSAADKLLHRMGYAPASARNPAGSPGGGNAVQNNFFVSGADIAAARELMQEANVLCEPAQGPGGSASPSALPPLEGEAKVVNG